MTNNERYFNILMKLAVDKCMEDEIAEFDALDTSDVIVPEKTKRKVMNSLRMNCLRESLGVKILKRVMVACLVMVTVMFTVAMSIKPIRAAFWEAVVTWYENYISIRYEANETDYPKLIEKRIMPQSLPSGWRIDVLDESDASVNYLITGTNGEIIYYDQIAIDNEEIWFNNKGAVEEKVFIDDNEAYIYSYRDGESTEYNVIWRDEYIFILSSEHVSKEILIQIAETIK